MNLTFSICGLLLTAAVAFSPVAWSANAERASDLAGEGQRRVSEGDYLAGQRLYERALKSWASLESAEAIRTATWLSILYIETNQVARTSSLYKRLEALPHDRLAQDNPSAAIDLWVAMAGQCVALHDLKAASNWVTRARTRFELSSGRAGARASAIEAMGAAIAEQQGDWIAAASRYRAALEVADDAFSRSVAYIGLAGVLARLGSRDEGERTLADGLTLLREMYGPSHPLLRHAYLSYAAALKQSGNGREAKRWDKAADRMRSASVEFNSVIDVRDLQPAVVAGQR